jgi:hypothetical protein
MMMMVESNSDVGDLSKAAGEEGLAYSTTTSAAVGGCKRGCRQGSGMERWCTCVPHAHPGEASSDACFRWTAGPDTRLLIAVVSLQKYYSSTSG